MNLNPQQLEAVHHPDGPLLILAGAGTGKTRVITHRIAYLIKERKVPPWNILAVTFTNKAAEEMRSRVAALFAGESERASGLARARERGAGGWGPEGAAFPPPVWIATFHSSCVRILRKSLPTGRNQFVIYDDDDSLALIKECLEEMKIEERALPPRAVYARIQGAKNDLVTPAAYARAADDFFASRTAQVYERYQKKIVENNALDFGDLIAETVGLFRERPDVLAQYQDLFRHILIDEYQDTNHSQYALTRLLAERHRNLCVVGDDDQSIYRWRGADIGNILNFEADYPGCRVIRLEQNYRSTQTILSIANGVISRNAGRKGKSLWTDQSGGEKATLFVAADERQEAAFVAGEIARRVEEVGRRYNDFAIFYRTNAQSRVFEDELRGRRIPYTIFGGTRFYDRKEIKDILAYARVLVNPRDSVNLKRILNVPPRGLGPKALEHLESFAGREGGTLREAISRAEEIPSMAEATKKRLGQFHRMVEGWGRDLMAGSRVAALFQKIMEETGYLDALERERTVESEGRIENLSELLNVADEFGKKFVGAGGPRPGEETSPLPLFLDQVSLVGDADAYDPEKGVVPMMTLHLAKGLEFPLVFLVGMEEGLFPHARSLDDPDELEEERRLCYVGITRARENLFLCLAAKRRLYGGEQFSLPSRFLEEMPEELVERSGSEGSGFAGPERGGMGAGRREPPFYDQRPEEEIGGIRIGATVRHPTFGIGVVKRHEGVGENQKVMVYFTSGLVKTLMVKFAGLSVLSPPPK